MTSSTTPTHQAKDLDTDDLNGLLQRGFRYALSLRNDRNGAEDLLQGACLRLSRKGGPWRFQYLVRVIRNLHIDQHRRDQKVMFERLHDVAGVEPPTNVLRDDALERALGRLRPEDRELLYLSAVEGYTASEIGELTGKPRGTVLSALHRAKEKLRDLLGIQDERDVS